MSQLSRQLSIFCSENPNADICKNINSAIPYAAIVMVLGGAIGTLWMLLISKKESFNNIHEYGFFERLAFSSLPLCVALLGYQALTNPDGESLLFFSPFILAIPAAIKHKKLLLKWLTETNENK